MKKYLLEITVFICGAELMILELVGSRVLSPYLGSTLPVWTSLIGVILGCLSLGYWWGGKLADRVDNWAVGGAALPGKIKILSGVIFWAAVSVGLLAVFKERAMWWFQNNGWDLRLSATAAALLLFGVPSVLLGAVSPLAAKIRIKSIKKSGSAVGSLYAISTLGSIAGTFLAGFYLIAYLGTGKILILTAVILAGLSLVVDWSWRTFAWRLGMGAVFYLMFQVWGRQFLSEVILDRDSQYNRIWIVERESKVLGGRLRVMKMNRENDSAIFLDREGIPFAYIRFYNLAGFFKPDIQKALMIGGAAGTYANEFLKAYPGAEMTMVELDSETTRLGREYFGLKEDVRLSYVHEDGRTFLNRNKELYDVMFFDVFKSETIPHQLATRETFEKVSQGLSDEGVLMANVVGSLEGRGSRLLWSVVGTIKSVFPQVLLYPIGNPNDKKGVQNIMVVALKRSVDLAKIDREGPGVSPSLAQRWRKAYPADLLVMTDDYAPTEYFQSLWVK